MGRVLVVRYLADEKRRPNSIGMCKIRRLYNGRRQPFQLFVGRLCSVNRGEEIGTGRACSTDSLGGRTLIFPDLGERIGP